MSNTLNLITISNINTNTTSYQLELKIINDLLYIFLREENENIYFQNKFSFYMISLQNLLIKELYNDLKELSEDIKEYIIVNINKKDLLNIFNQENIAVLTIDYNLFEESTFNFKLEFILYQPVNTNSLCEISNFIYNQLETSIDKSKKIKSRINLIMNDINTKRKERTIENMNNKLEEYIKTENNIINQERKDFNDTLRKMNYLYDSIKIIKNDIINNFFNINYSEIDKTNQIFTNIFISEHEKYCLQKFFSSQYDLVPLYNSYIDGDSSSSFYKSTKDINNILIIVQTEDQRFGGYSSLTWEYNDSEMKYKGGDLSAFIFSFNLQLKLSIKPEEIDKVISCSSQFGLRFGSHDIIISDKFTTNSNSYSCVFGSYGTIQELNIQNKDYSQTNPSYLLVGKENFRVDFLEAYQVIFK